MPASSMALAKAGKAEERGNQLQITLQVDQSRTRRDAAS
jgi:hypothetical protein